MDGILGAGGAPNTPSSPLSGERGRLFGGRRRLGEPNLDGDGLPGGGGGGGGGR